MRDSQNPTRRLAALASLPATCRSGHSLFKSLCPYQRYSPAKSLQKQLVVYLSVCRVVNGIARVVRRRVQTSSGTLQRSSGTSGLPLFLTDCLVGEFWLRGKDLNLRPLGYEPNELPDCSTPHHQFSAGAVSGSTFELTFTRESRNAPEFSECSKTEAAAGSRY
jgi:hypothetical protein